MGCSTSWRIANKFAALGLISEKPKTGRGNGSSYAYVHHMKSEGYVGYAKMTYKVLVSVLERFEAGELSTERSKFVAGLIGSPTKITCNLLYLWDRGDNPKDRCKEFVFFKSYDEAVMFSLFLDETPSFDDYYLDQKQFYLFGVW